MSEREATTRLTGHVKDDVTGVPLDRGWAWVICLSVFMVTLTTSLYDQVLAVTFVDVVDRFSVTFTSASLVFTLFALSQSVGSVLSTSLIIPRVGERPVIVLASVANALVTVLVALSPHIAYFHLMHCLKGLFIGSMWIPSLGLLGKYFRTRRSLATALCNTGIGVGLLACPPLVRALMDTYGFRGTMLLVSALEMHAIPAAMLLRPVDSFRCRNNNNNNNSTTTVQPCDDSSVTYFVSSNNCHDLGHDLEFVYTPKVLANGFTHASSPHGKTENGQARIRSDSLTLEPLMNGHAHNLHEYENSGRYTQSDDADQHTNSKLANGCNTDRQIKSEHTDKHTDRHIDVDHSDDRKSDQSNRHSESCHTDRQIESDLIDRQIEYDVTDRQIKSDLTDRQLQSDLTHRQVHPNHTDRQVESDLTHRQVHPNHTDRQVESDLTDRQVESDLTDRQVESDLTHRQVESDLTDRQLDSGLTHRQIESDLTERQLHPNHTDMHSESCRTNTLEELKDNRQSVKPLELCDAHSSSSDQCNGHLHGKPGQLTMWSDWMLRMLLCSTCCGVLVLYIPTYIPTLAVSRGLDKGTAAILLTVCGGVNLASLLLQGLLVDSQVISAACFVALAQVAVGTLCHAVYALNSLPGLLVLSVAHGMFGGARMAFMPVVATDYMGLARLGRTLGLNAFVATLSISAHHPLLGYLLEKTGSFNVPFHYVGVALYLSSAIMALQPICRRLNMRKGAQLNRHDDVT